MTARRRGPSAARLLAPWFDEVGWRPFAFQKETWEAYAAGESGLVHAATGSGKTLAVWLAPLLQWLRDHPDRAAWPRTAPPIQVLWITPLRALAADTEENLRRPLEALELPWSLQRRTGDSSAGVKAQQRKRLPTALITTPESLSLLLSHDHMLPRLAGLKLVVVDEWHELLGTKRGVQTELGLARLRRLAPGLRTWGLSATIGNLDEALAVLLGSGADEGRIIRGAQEKQTQIRSLIPSPMERFPWAGHIGTRMVPAVIDCLEQPGTTLLFTNVRSQTELWYQAILAAKSEWAGELAIHHGSLDKEVRDWVEDQLRLGKLRGVVCTSSLDLGVDFAAVDRVIQVGSPKGVARLLQRAGRSGHQPGAESVLTFVPTHALELVELAAARDAMQSGYIEARVPLELPLDVLAQHVVTVAASGGFRSDELLAEVQEAHAYRNLTRQQWEWTLEFVTQGGSSLQAYPDFRRVVRGVDDLYRIADEQTARMHRMQIGTITSDAAMRVQYLSGGNLGTVEESFLSRLSPGDRFLFAGRTLELVRIRDMTAIVRKAKGAAQVPRWMGGRMPLSTELAQAVRRKLEQVRDGEFRGVEMTAVRSLLRLQQEWSALPKTDELLIERIRERSGHHLFIYPFEGRLVHEGLAALWAQRLARLAPITFTMACNDYGLVLSSAEPAPLDRAILAGLLSPDRLIDDVLASLNGTEMAKRQFREIARVAGLIFQGYPGSHKSTRQLQASSSLFFDVFSQYDPENLLLAQATREVLEQQLEHQRLAAALARLGESRLVIAEPAHPTPLAFPLLVDRLREKLSSEKLADRVRKMQLKLEKAAG